MGRYQRFALAGPTYIAGDARNSADLLIASTARVHNLIIVSRNARDFAGTGVVVYDPWNGETHRMELA
jgi:predicted nucleic acid-binding protein